MTSSFRKVLINNSPINRAKYILGPSKNEMQLQLMNDERTTAGAKGGTTLIGQGLKIEDSQ